MAHTVLRAALIIACLGVFLQVDGQPLPRLDWGTYQGGNAADALRDIETDGAGNIYVIGSTSSASGIATPGAQQPGISSPPDAYIAKFNPRGELIWSTYLGGEGSDQGQHLALDTSGHLYVSGFTSSTTGIATPGAHQTALLGMNDAFVAKFDTNGVLLWASYFGGSEGETCNGVTVDGDGYVTIVGWTNSNDNIASPGAHQLIFRGQQDIFIAQFDSFGNRRWSTYYGDIGFDIGLQIEATETGDLVIAGWTSSVINIASPGAWQPAFAGGTADACLIKFSATGSRIWSTYYGGPTDEYGDALALAANGDILLAGPTNSAFGLATGGTHQAAPAGAFDGYVARFDPMGSRLWGTYYGGPDIDVIYGIGESPAGDILITGHTRSTSGISTPPTHQPASGGDWDAFLAALNATGERQWGTYYGGPGIDQSFGLAMDSLGFMYLAGFTNSASGISTPGVLQESPAGGNESLVARFAPCLEPVLTLQNGGYLCDGSNFVMDLIMTGSPPFAITYSLDGVVQPVVVADTAHFYHLISTAWSDSIKLISVSSGPCTGVIAGPTDFVVAADPVTVSNLQIACDQDSLTYIVSGQLSGGLFGYLDAGTTPVMITDSQFVSAPLPFAQAYDIGITSGLLCDTILLQAASGCAVICPDSFGVTGPDTIICNGSDISLFAGGGVAYEWSGPDGFFSLDAAPIIPAAAGVHAGLYTVIITDPKGCQDTLSTLVNIQTIAGNLQGDPVVCEGSAIHLIASGGMAYAWSGPDGFNSAFPDPIITNATLAQSGTYTVTLTDDLGCTTTLSIDIAVAPPPDITLASNGPVCEGDVLSLSATGGTMYAWSGPGGYTGNQQAIVRPAMSAADAGEYRVVVTTADGCIDSAVAEVIVLPAPMVTFTILQPVCAGGELTLLAQGAASYAWSGPNGFTSDQANPVISPIGAQQSGAYTLVGTAANGCRDSITQDIAVQPIPEAIATSDRPAYCEGDTAFLSVTAASAYSWSGPDQFSAEVQMPVLNDLRVLQQGDYQVTITDDNGCENTAVVTLAVDTAPVFQLVYDLIGCEGDTVSAFAVGDTGTYRWTGPQGFSASGVRISVPTAVGGASGPYILTVTNAGGCSRRDSVWFDIRPRPEAGITGPDTICAGTDITLTATGGESYAWLHGHNADVLMVRPQITTSFTVFVSSGPCRDTAEWTVYVRPLPVLSIVGPAEIDIGETAALEVSGADSYAWQPNDGLSCLTCPDPVVSPVSTTTYCVTGELDGCVTDTCVTVAVREECDLILPNVITPNGDGINDAWCNPKPACADEQHLTIYDRWGGAQYRQSGSDVCWDGRIRGEPANPGVFAFVLELRRAGKESQYIRGDITVLR